MKKNKSASKPWTWVPTLYYAEGIPYVIVMTVSVIMYKRLGVSNTDIALYTSWLYLPWVIKPLWSPIVDILRTKRYWIITMQLLIGAGLAGVALTIPIPNYFQFTLAFFWLLAFSSATHDIAADGFYMLGLDEHEQAYFVGIRSTFYRFAMITGQGLLIILAGYIESSTGLPPVQISAETSNQFQNEKFINPDSVLFSENIENLEILHFPETVKISTENISTDEADSILAFVKVWNTSNGFYENHIQKSAGKSNSKNGFWDKYIVSNATKLLKDLFGKKVQTSKQGGSTGNIGAVYFRLSKVPDDNDEIVVNFGSESGDKSINLIEGGRFVFTSKNWNRPAVALIQIDSKLKGISSANFEARAGNIQLAWIVTFFILSAMFVVFFIYHKFKLPHPASDKAANSTDENAFAEFFKVFAKFFRKKHIWLGLTFILLYRLGESQLVKLASPFMLDPRELGGLGLTTGEVGIIYGTIGLLSLTIGGILGGLLASKDGLKYWLWPMVFAINLPNAVYIYLSMVQPESFLLISASVAVEQFGYGFGFTAFMLYMIYISDGDNKTAHFAIATGFMALGMMIPGMISGWLQEIIGYQNFFIWVLIATIPAFVLAKFIPIDSEFGKKTGEVNNA